MKKQIQQQPIPQPTNLTQNFQLAPSTNREVIRYANSIEEVKRDAVIGDTPFFSKDLSVMWIKNHSGDIKAYELSEIVQKDEKDLQIDLLMAKINELEGMIKNESTNTNANEPETTKDTSTNDKPVGESTKASKSTGISRVSKSKAE
jgi:hypothetical protein